MITTLFFISILLVAFILVVRRVSKSDTSKENSSKSSNISSREHLKEKITFQKKKEEESKKKPELREIVGFYTGKEYSPNKEYCIVSVNGISGKKGSIALVKDGALLFKVSVSQPNDCHTSNNGVTICCDWTNSGQLAGKFLVFDVDGNQVYSKKVSANLGVSAISKDGDYAIFETHYSETSDSNKVFVLDIQQQKIIGKFDRPLAFTKAEVIEDKKTISLINRNGIAYKVDFEGTQVNFEEYKSHLFKRGSLTERIYFFESNMPCQLEEVRLYIEVLNKALADQDAAYVFGEDKLYRKLGEQYEAIGEIDKVILYWEKALKLNSKVGVKRKFEQYIQKVNQ